jgi:hypothetical protein
MNPRPYTFRRCLTALLQRSTHWKLHRAVETKLPSKLISIHKFGDMMSDGYICTPEDLALSRNSSVPLVYCLTRGQSFGLLVEWFSLTSHRQPFWQPYQLNAESAVISLIAVTLVFGLLLVSCSYLVQLLRCWLSRPNKRNFFRSARWIQSPIDLYMVSFKDLVTIDPLEAHIWGALAFHGWSDPSGGDGDGCQVGSQWKGADRHFLYRSRQAPCVFHLI